MNLLAFLLDLYVGSTRSDPGITRLRSVTRAFLTVKTWSRLEVAHMLSDELWCNWFSLEQKARLSCVFTQNPNLGKLEVPMAWSVNESFSTSWKANFEPLRLWIAGQFQEGDRPEKTASWIPMVWPSYLAAFRWQLLLATRGPASQKVTLPPERVGFPSSALAPTEIFVGEQSALVNVHFLLPEEAFLRLTNPDVPVFDEQRGGQFSPYQYKAGSRCSGKLFRVLSRFSIGYCSSVVSTVARKPGQSWGGGFDS